MGIMIEVDDGSFENAVAKSLLENIEYFEKALQLNYPNIFVYGDPIKDKALIQDNIDAFKLVRSWYCAV